MAATTSVTAQLLSQPVSQLVTGASRIVECHRLGRGGVLAQALQRLGQAAIACRRCRATAAAVRLWRLAWKLCRLVLLLLVTPQCGRGGRCFDLRPAAVPAAASRLAALPVIVARGWRPLQGVLYGSGAGRDCDAPVVRH